MELIQQLKEFYLKLHLEVKSLQALRFARRLVYAWAFINYAILATKAAYFYSSSAYIPAKDFDSLNLLEKSLNLLHWGPFADAYPVFLALILAATAFAFFEKAPRASAAVVYFLMMNLDNKAYVTLDGGNNLMHLVTFYLIFINTKETQSAFSITLTNLAALMIKIQVTLVYATAGLLKVMGPLWNKGVALYYTMGVSEYGNHEIFKTLANYPLLLAAMTLGTVLFQISLPYLIWQRNWRPYIVLMGTALHLSISLVMGLFMFGFAMCVSYFFFYEDGEKGLFGSLLKRVRV
ncbi:hypothetical protein [Bdellovibrio bacteriovorus]|uniref:hypothetical protein n=1 Tax=Bdellovibrio bacteriovorus TaxID=959 RepID=UPI003A801283